MSDKILLLIGVNGFVLAGLLLAVWLFFPIRSAVTTDNDLPGIRMLAVDGLRSTAEKLSPSGSNSKIQNLLDRAGNTKGWNPERVFFAKSLSAISFLVVSSIFAARWAGTLLSSKAVLVIFIITIFGFYLPNILLYNVATKRQQQIQKDLPDVIDLMSVSMKAGLGFDAAIAKVATNSNGPLAFEFARMLQEFRLGQSRSEVLKALIDRSTVTELHHVVQALIQADALGIPIADVLLVQSNEMRIKRRQRAEEKAQKVTVKILFPMLLCIFPALLVVVVGPAAINIARSFSSW